MNDFRLIYWRPDQKYKINFSVLQSPRFRDYQDSGAEYIRQACAISKRLRYEKQIEPFIGSVYYHLTCCMDIEKRENNKEEIVGLHLTLSDFHGSSERSLGV